MRFYKYCIIIRIIIITLSLSNGLGHNKSHKTHLQKNISYFNDWRNSLQKNICKILDENNIFTFQKFDMFG